MAPPPRAGRDTGQPRCLAALQGPHRLRSQKGCSAAPLLRAAAGSHGRRSCQVPLPAALRARAGAGKSGSGLRAPMGALARRQGGGGGAAIDVLSPENAGAFKGPSGDSLFPQQSPRISLARTLEPPVGACNCSPKRLWVMS